LALPIDGVTAVTPASSTTVYLRDTYKRANGQIDLIYI